MNYKDLHKKEILEILNSGKSINFLKAEMELFCYNLQEIILELEAEGLKIIRFAELQPNGNVLRSYKLA